MPFGQIKRDALARGIPLVFRLIPCGLPHGTRVKPLLHPYVGIIQIR